MWSITVYASEDTFHSSLCILHKKSLNYKIQKKDTTKMLNNDHKSKKKHLTA
jgi:hypothetical protein